MPSQITYVLSSRFQPERGYIVESKRVAGYIRVVRLELSDGVAGIMRSVGKSLSQDEAHGYLLRLFDEGLIDAKCYRMMQAALSRDTLALDLPHRDWLRARMFKALLHAYFSAAEDKE